MVYIDYRIQLTLTLRMFNVLKLFLLTGAGSPQQSGGARNREQPPHQAAGQAEEREVGAAQGTVTVLIV